MISEEDDYMDSEKTKYRGREFSTDHINAALEILGQNSVMENILAISMQYDSHLPTLLEGIFSLLRVPAMRRVNLIAQLILWQKKAFMKLRMLPRCFAPCPDERKNICLTREKQQACLHFLLPESISWLF